MSLAQDVQIKVSKSTYQVVRKINLFAIVGAEKEKSGKEVRKVAIGNKE